MSVLTAFEREAVSRLLERDDPAHVVLRKQAAHVIEGQRTFSGVGLFVDLVLESGIPRLVTNRRRIIISGIDAVVEGLRNGVGVILFVDDGYLSMFEAFTYDEPWPDKFEVVGWRYDEELEFPRTS